MAETLESETEVVVLEKRQLALDVVELQLGGLGGSPLPPWEPGAHVDVRHAGDDRYRQYSLTRTPTENGTWRIALLRGDEGGVSRHLHDNVRTGDTLYGRGPRNHFALEPSPRYLFIAGGIGITPIVPMLHAAEAAGAEWQLLYGGRDFDSMAFREDLQGFGDRVTIVSEKVDGLLDLASWLGEPRADTLVYCCGPEGLLAAVESQCVIWPRGALHVERFAAKAQPTDGTDSSFQVELARSGVTLPVPADRSILDVLRDNGIDVMASCEAGSCGSCETTVNSGVPDHRDCVLSDEEKAANTTMMVCVSRSLTEALVLDL